MSPLVSHHKIPASVLSNSPQSDIFPGMVKISSLVKKNESTETLQTQQINTHESLDMVSEPTKNMLLPLGITAITGFAIGRGTAKTIERPIDNFPAGIIGAALCGAAVLGTTGFYVAQYGGFFDKDRDFKTMFKNL